MEVCALQHQTDSRYSFPLDGDRAFLRLRTGRGDPDIKKVRVIWNSSFMYWKKRNVSEMSLARHDALYDYYEGVISNGKPGYTYLFELTDAKGKKWYYNETGLSDTLRVEEGYMDNFNVMFPNERDIVRANPAFEGRVFYQIFPERFAMGSGKTNTEYIDMDWYTEEPDNMHYMGGDLRGIREKLDYLKELGVGAIYMTPIHPSSTAHKYDVEDYMGVDPMFGTQEDLHELVEDAHKHDIKIVMDFVFNHSSNKNPMFLDVVKKGKESHYYDWYFIDGDRVDMRRRNYETFASVKQMPKLNTNNPEVQDYLISVGKFYMTKHGVDGFRLDVANDVSHAFWRRFKAALREVNPDVFLIGEHWQNAESFLGNDQWDSVMNYPVRYACQRFLAEDRYDAAAFCDYLNGVLVRYKDGTNRNMLNLLDSHDTPRFFEMTGHDKNRTLLAQAAMLFYQGCPMLYYGDEIFMDGKQDPYCRKGMRWNSPEFESAEHGVLLELLKLRAGDVLRKGDIQIYEKDGLAFLERSYNGETLTLVLNHSGSEKPCPAGERRVEWRTDGSTLQNDGFVVIGG